MLAAGDLSPLSVHLEDLMPSSPHQPPEMVVHWGAALGYR